MENDPKFPKSLENISIETSEFYIEEEDLKEELVEGNKFKFKKFESIYLPAIVKNLSSIKLLEFLPNDTFVIGYPKSGTTWVEEIVWLLQNNLDFDESLKTSHFDRVYFIDMGLSKEKINQMSRNRVFKSHLPIKYLPDNIHNKSKVKTLKEILFYFFL